MSFRFNVGTLFCFCLFGNNFFSFNQWTLWIVMSVYLKPLELAIPYPSNVSGRIISVVLPESLHMQVGCCMVWSSCSLFGISMIYNGYCLVAGQYKVLDMNVKSCVLAQECVNGSINLGTARTAITSKCCNSDLCNSQPAPGNLHPLLGKW